MGKALGCLIGLFTFSVLVESVGIFLFTILVLAFTGHLIGENGAMLAIYIIGAMSASYVLPVLLSIYQQRFSLLIIVPVITSIVLAFPSSFVFNAGCEAGRQEAVWAMRAVPIMWAGELLLATKSDDLPQTCRKVSRQP